jgi:hypothetical protein
MASPMGDRQILPVQMTAIRITTMRLTGAREKT